jgi:hypothetical protein
VPALTIAALAVAAGTAFSIWAMGRRFTRRYIELHGKLPGPSWMFKTQEDPELEAPRRRALALLPILVVAAIVYVATA